ncbi:acyl carrier protein phosphodiesterase [Nostoc sp. UHCC 0302]|uniref:acyl carrier protein phosphodiesterase n=1 Tax=Nostoc sp. UHCC 0302 TaxID=3134896 RepID=UPI00311CDE4F
MNWLAHLLLSEADVESRLGNLLADIVKGTVREELNSNIQHGIKCHLVIDKFTDSHIVVQRSKDRINPSYRRFAGVLVDVFYDHYLAKNWSEYSHVSLDEFTAKIYKSFQAYQGEIPVTVTEMITRMAVEDWLGAYRNVAGVENTLERISKRLSMRCLRRPSSFAVRGASRREVRATPLTPAVSELTTHYDAFEDDFQEFFPELISHVQNWCLV